MGNNSLCCRHWSYIIYSNYDNLNSDKMKFIGIYITITVVWFVLFLIAILLFYSKWWLFVYLMGIVILMWINWWVKNKNKKKK